ncbi:unnamed protein product [Schistocephalus solidus]|uniref:Uncharacterized protein n=1 Tax=Schistocephalus solidus TaxID=70667 RepID=A0A183T5R3_SCHSO|nr:unnamed protein product [Schistocephalus solidus]
MRTWILGILLVLALAVCLEAKKDEESLASITAVEPKDNKSPKRRRYKNKHDSQRRGNGNGHKRGKEIPRMTFLFQPV